MDLRITDLIRDGLWSAVATLALAAMAWQVYRPWVPAPDGARGYRRRVPVAGRLRLHRAPLLALGLICLAGWSVGALPPAVMAIAGLVALAILVVPVHYTVTTAGIALGRTPLRRWTEFGGLRVRGGRVRLLPVVGCAGMTVWVGRGRGREDFVLAMRGAIRRAYRPVYPAGAAYVEAGLGPAEDPLAATALA